MGVLARLTGFDALGYMTDDCPNLYYLMWARESGQHIRMINSVAVRSLVSSWPSMLPSCLSFTMCSNSTNFQLENWRQRWESVRYSKCALRNLPPISTGTTHQMQLSGFINSPGYHGCPGKPVGSFLHSNTLKLNISRLINPVSMTWPLK